jgi:putative peptide zinc metalloprotease protein
MVVPASATVALPGATASTRFGEHPRLRSGHALKRLDASEGVRRWVLKDLVSGTFVRMSDDDARLVQLMDGRSLSQLVRESERQLGADGSVVLAKLLADLAEKGLLAGSTRPGPPARRGLARLFSPHSVTWSGAGDFFARLYSRGGRLLYMRPALAGLPWLPCTRRPTA